ncbi:ankyrin, partial [Fistulina hepatica ATCC 64428]
LRGLPDGGDDNNSVEWSAVEEGFRLLERDLGKLQQFVELNATGFRKILKKYDKRSRTTTKEMYLARQVEVQPVFNRQVFAACLLDITDLSSGLRFEGAASTDILSQQLMSERLPHMGPFNDLEKSLRKAVTSSDSAMIYDCVRYADALAHQEGAKPNVTRILWKVIIEAPQDLADLILTSLATPFDFQFIDDINGRTCLHEAVIAGCLRLADICIEKGVPVAKADSYGRTALHYACMHGYPEVCRHLIEVGVPADTRDMDNYSPLVYATLRGSVECVRILLDLAHIPAQPLAPTGDLIPLSLACQSGHFDIALFLLQRGAKCTSNSNGEYPMHLAAREGHTQICQLLLNSEGWDLPDKYHDWTPLFHAARFGHSECVHILLEAGSRAHVLDEHGHAAAHYAAWHGHYTSMKALLAASKAQPAVAATPASSPASDIPHTVDAEIEGIPSLLLPPPIIPHRVYGHNYLDRTHLVQICLGSSLSRRQGTPAVRLRHRLISPVFNDEYLVKSTPLKLVIITTDPTVNSGPYTVPLPQVDVHEVFSFQVPSLDKLSLEMSIYPNFGTKTIGRAVALPSIFTCDQGVHQAVLPILDTRLHVVGEVRLVLRARLLCSRNS